MGTFYGSIQIRTKDVEAVKIALGEVARETDSRFLLGPAIDGWVSVFPNHGGQSDEISAQLAKRVSKDIMHLVVHDDDIFSYYFYRNGRRVDQYNSCPDYFGNVSGEEKLQCAGRPELFQDLLPTSEAAGKLKALLTAAEGGEFIFEFKRMEQFCKLLGFSNALSSYDYLQAGQRDGIKGWRKFVHIPDLTAEKAAKRAAKAQITSKKKRLQKEALLFAEIRPPMMKGQEGMTRTIWTIDPASHGLVLLWCFHGIPEPSGENQNTTEFFSAQPPWDASPRPTGLRANLTGYRLSMSPSGKWLGAGFAAGDWKTRVWDWRRKEFAFEIDHTRAVGWLAFSQNEQQIYSLGGDEFIVSSLAENRPVIMVKGMEGARSAAVHPAGKFAAVGLQDRLGIIDLEKSQLVKSLWV